MVSNFGRPCICFSSILSLKTSDFNAIAPYYDQLAKLVFGSVIREAQRVFLNEIKTGDTVLIVGGGTGWILRYVLEHNPKKITYLESSRKMVALTLEKIVKDKLENVQVIHGDIWDFRSHEMYDVLITFFFLDLFPSQRLENIMKILSRNVKDQGRWLFCDFQIHHARWWHKAMVSSMYAFFRILSSIPAKALPDFSSSFSRLGWKSCRTKTFYGGMIVSNIFKRKA